MMHYWLGVHNKRLTIRGSFGTSSDDGGTSRPAISLSQTTVHRAKVPASMCNERTTITCAEEDVTVSLQRIDEPQCHGVARRTILLKDRSLNHATIMFDYVSCVMWSGCNLSR